MASLDTSDRAPSVPDNAADDPAGEEMLRLYRQAFVDYKAIALWNVRELSNPKIGHVLSVARRLRIEGNMSARRLAERIEAQTLARL